MIELSLELFMGWSFVGDYSDKFELLVIAFYSLDLVNR
jgi:hypothetical protein